MTIPLAGVILIAVAIIGGAIAMGAFIWAIRTKQFKDLNTGAYVIFDKEEPVGEMTDTTFGYPEKNNPKKEENKNEV
ncbi:hypothetical protein HRbin37_02071 [bacterium HR37]|nr:hypothetical protein HRbin37_02071 [bacterium HR37]